MGYMYCEVCLENVMVQIELGRGEMRGWYLCIVFVMCVMVCVWEGHVLVCNVFVWEFEKRKRDEGERVRNCKNKQESGRERNENKNKRRERRREGLPSFNKEF